MIKKSLRLEQLISAHGGIGRCAGQVWQQVPLQVPVGYIHIYEQYRECYNINLMSLWRLPFYFLFKKYLFINRSLFSIKKHQYMTGMCLASVNTGACRHAGLKRLASLKIGDKVISMGGITYMQCWAQRPWKTYIYVSLM